MTGSSPFRFSTGSATDRGLVRKANEDALLAAPHKALWAVADGMGGHDDGARASRLIVAALDGFDPPDSAADLLARCADEIATVNDALYDDSRRRGVITGATLVVLLVYDAHYACLWAGDSRLYLLRGGTLQQITRDHTEVADMVAAGLLTEDEARLSPRRNIITRAIGVSERPELDLHHAALAPGDVFVLCSDGLTGHVDDHEIEEVAITWPDPQDYCDRLVALTLQRGASDNVTVVAVRVDGD